MSELCVCDFGPMQSSSDVLMIIYTALQVILFSYILYKINIPDKYEKSGMYLKIFLVAFIFIGLVVCIFSVINVYKGIEESLKLRNMYCKGEKIQRKKSKDCPNTRQKVIDYVNLFNSVVTCIFSLFITILFMLKIDLVKGKKFSERSSERFSEKSLFDVSFGKTKCKKYGISFLLPLFTFILSLLSASSAVTTVLSL